MKTPIDMMFDGVAWSEAPAPERVDGIPHVTHAGVLELPGMLPMRCYRLSDGRTVLDGDDMAAWLHDMDPDPPEVIKKMIADSKIQFQR